MQTQSCRWIFGLMLGLGSLAHPAAASDLANERAQDPTNYPTPTVKTETPSNQRDVEAPQSAVTLACPLELKNRVLATGLEGANWSVGGSEQTAPLKGARLFNGPVSEKTIEQYNEMTAIPYLDRKTSEFRQVWAFEDNAVAAGIVLVCDYAGSTQFLMHAVPPQTKECRETNVLDQQDKNTTRVQCR
jgi:hypothetical protein